MFKFANQMQLEQKGHSHSSLNNQKFGTDSSSNYFIFRTVFLT